MGLLYTANYKYIIDTIMETLEEKLNKYIEEKNSKKVKIILNIIGIVVRLSVLGQ